MKKYFSTFITGTEKIIELAIKNRPTKKIRINLLMDGLVVYESSYEEREIRNIRFFNNSFVLLDSFESLAPTRESVEKIMAKVSKDSALLQKMGVNLLKERKDFKIITSLENQLVSVDRAILKNLETNITRFTDLRLNPKRPNLELWFLVRSDERGFFGIRITYPDRKTPVLSQGELRHELANILCQVSEPSPDDIVMDPFAGYGAIPLERATGFPYKKIIASDSNDKMVKQITKKIPRTKKNISVMKADTSNLQRIANGEIDKIITDPPWGIYKETAIPLEEFYQIILQEFGRVLRIDGLAVVLTGNQEKFNEALSRTTKIFKMEAEYNILVSGKKASIYKLRKQ